MPAFDNKAVHRFWKDYQDSTIYKVIVFMESVEDWTMDGDPDLEAGMQRLGDALKDIGNIDLQLEGDLIDLLAHIKTGRGLRLLMCLDIAYPGAASRVLSYAEGATKSNNDMAGIFLRRNVIFERLRLMGRVFGQDRFELILTALENSDYE